MLSRLKLLISFSIILFCAGCQRFPLLVDFEYVGARSLASYYVRTPDPKRCCPDTGQRLIVQWRFPKEYLTYRDPHIHLTVRFGNNEEDEIEFPIPSPCGQYTYSVLNNDYWDRCGITTYQAQFIADGCVLEEWQHQLWAELIEFDIDDNTGF